MIGVGASAGGFEAFKKLLSAIPANSGLAFILVQHLDPNHESILTELIQKVTSIPVIEVSNGAKILPDHIYVIPSNKILTIQGDTLILEPPAKNKNERSLPIDIFFSSLAEAHHSNAIGIVLSGTGSDGTRGLKAIKEHGGITFAQSEESAAFPGMPDNARLSGAVDFSLEPEQIPQKLLEVTKITNYQSATGETDLLQEDEAFRQILELLRIRKTTDFTYYKQTTIRRRIFRRMALSKNDSPASYLKYLRENKEEQDMLYQDLLISVTSFFRDQKSFEILCEIVFPGIIKHKNENDPIRIWVAGCSTGQEAYSMAICLKEFLGNNSERVQIFATDLSEAAIQKARSGTYTRNELDGLSPHHLQEFFLKTNEGYQVKNTIRDICVFAVHNFLKDPPFGKLDLVSCRNVLIYMEPFLQKKALTTFHYALNKRGFLFLGKSETISSVTELFGNTHKPDKIFHRKDVPSKVMITASEFREKNLIEVDNKSFPDKQGRADFQKTADDIILNKYAPAGVVVNEAMDIVQFRGKTSMYLEQFPGKPSHNLIKLAKGGLAFELRNIIHKVKKEQKTIIKENIQWIEDENLRVVSVEAMPLEGTIDAHYMILFHESVGDKSKTNNHRISADNTSSEQNATTAGSHIVQLQTQISLLKKELSELREDMRTVTEDQETVNEELQSANEELLSSSEELQSLNEELETSKEELQSTNEELTIVNQELIALNIQVTEARNYAETIIATLREPLLVLNKNLRIVTANESFYRVFQVTENDTEGKLIYQVGERQLDIPELIGMLENVLREKKNFTDFEISFNAPVGGQRTMLLNVSEIIRENGADKLILISFEDITERRRLHVQESKLLTKFQNLVTQAPVAIVILRGSNYEIELANEYFLKLVDREKDFVGQQLFQFMPELLNQGIKPILDDVMQSGLPHSSTELEISISKKGKSHNGFYNFSYEPMWENDESISGVMIVGNEVTEQVLARKKIEASEERYHTLITSSPSAIGILKGWDLVITTANDAIIEIWGKGKEILGKPYFEALPELAEQGYVEIFHRVYDTGIPFNAVETPVRILQNGKMELKYYNFLLYPQRNISGEIDGIGIIASEVTSQAILNKAIKESEEHFRLLAELMPAKISNALPDGSLTYFNKKWLDFTGYTFEEMKDFGYQKILHPDELVVFQHKLQEAAKTGNVLEMEMRFLDKEGNYKWHLNFAAPIKDEAGNIRMWVGVTTEIQQQMEQRDILENAVVERTHELQYSNKELLQSNEDLQRFAHVASHDLREPLRKIATFANRLKDDDKTLLSERGGLFLGKILSASVRMDEMIQGVLNYSMIDTWEKNIEIIDLNGIIKDIENNLELLIQQKNAVIRFDRLPQILGAKVLIYQLFYNLIYNSLKFTRENEDQVITILSKTFGSGAEWFTEITIEDRGIGFDPDQSDKIFSAFARLNSKESYEGTGLGLTLCKKIVEKHGGTIRATGAENKGAKFIIVLPIKQPKDII